MLNDKNSSAENISHITNVAMFWNNINELIILGHSDLEETFNQSLYLNVPLYQV